MALSQIVTTVTRPKSGTCLDHCYASHPAFIADISVLNIGLADHLPVIFRRKYAKFKENRESEHITITFRETKNLNADDFLQSLEWIPWDSAVLFEDIDDILYALEYNYAKRSSRNQPPWMNDEILKSIRERDNLLKRARRSNFSTDWSLYVRAKCNTSNLIKHAKRCFFSGINK